LLLFTYFPAAMARRYDAFNCSTIVAHLSASHL
jgi:hypothetical protein